MGEISNNIINTTTAATKTVPCRAVALRYRFVFKKCGDGTSALRFLPHQVKELPVDVGPSCEKNDDDVVKAEDVQYEDDVDYLRSLDPKEWKKQDHYKVLGIPSLRHRASEEVIKTAYRKKVLKHHPDKRKALGEEVRADDDYFTCITMAYETLGNSIKRRAYDSVDPEFDDNLPSGDLKKDFYKTFEHYFDLNSRWSEKPSVPKLGGPNATREEVERFYSFWYDFKSWREYSYEDEEDKEKCSDRDERRFVDKMNKAERLRKKKEEMLRIRTLVDLAYNNDPRIAKFKQEDKDKKLALKRAKQTAAQAKKEEEERILKEAQMAKEKAEAAERAKLEAKRQEREAMKKALKKERKTLRDTCKANNYYSEDDKQIILHMTAVEKICETLSLLELEDVNKNLKKSDNAKAVFVKTVEETEARIAREREEVLKSANQKSNEGKSGEKTVMEVNAEWTHENLQLLIKAVNLFPAGTNQRWDVVANFINQHGSFTDGGGKFTAKAVLAKAKDLQSTDFSKNNLKETVNKQAFSNFKKNQRNTNALVIDESEISKKVDVVNSKKIVDNNVNGDVKPKQQDSPWSSAEQQLLEQALKTYPVSTPERWDRIAECIPNRTKKDCMKRYKELVETIKAKKAAQAAISAK